MEEGAKIILGQPLKFFLLLDKGHPGTEKLLVDV
jgi:hypothetical protein